MVFRNIIDQGRRGLRDARDIPLRRSLLSLPRPERSTPSIDDLPRRSVLIVVAHPDDEVLAAGALLADFPRAGVICVTNGAPRRETYARAAGFDNWMDYAEARQREAKAALSLAGREISPQSNMGLLDQEAVFNLVTASRYLAHQVGNGFDYVITHAYEGGHPDHDAAAFMVHAACALIAKAGKTPPVIAEAPLYSAPNGTYVFEEFVPHSDAGPAISFALSQEQQALKRRMFDCYATQYDVFPSFTVDSERFRVAPRYHFSASPHEGEVGFDQFRWSLTGKVWRTHAWRAMRELGMLQELA